MIGFYQDAALQDPALAATPKRFLLPLAGGVKPGTLYLGDPYTATVTAPAAIGATGISLDQTFEFPTSGSAVVYIPAIGSAPANAVGLLDHLQSTLVEWVKEAPNYDDITLLAIGRKYQ